MSLQMFSTHETLATTRDLADKHPLPLLSFPDPLGRTTRIIVVL